MFYNILLYAFAILLVTKNIKCVLEINVKAENGENVKENVDANSTENWVSFSYQNEFESMVEYFLDFKNEMLINKVIKFGERDLYQKPYIAYCYISHFNADDYIPSDAMRKLRQKNPWTIRTAEENLGTDTAHMDIFLNMTRLGKSELPYVRKLCGSALVYASSQDLGKEKEGDWSSLEHTGSVQSQTGLAACNLTAEVATARQAADACVCRVQACLWWYPCGLKFCTEKDDTGKAISYRCGIKTCKRCRNNLFRVSYRSDCI